ncbi:hypothetical protein U14_01077 [Candidatus Moduliflexus flocculans]|uniref:DUF4230 domain-containing protein n=1 Tax=Candidatus Moduliflexus flocculans TaxID=1499966 RepID=A0A0S6VR95_9BACT|nr:hypothetical protein U14_01077 [Candidatus Moduliflexus flocculans]
MKLSTKIILTTGVVAIVLGVSIIHAISKKIDPITDAIKLILESFKTQKITTEYKTYATEIKGTNRLQLATLKTQEIFTRTENLDYVWGLLKFSASVEISAPVEYTFYLELNDGWKFLINDPGNTQVTALDVYVLAPPIQANAPAIHVSEWQIKDGETSVMIDEGEMKNNLIRELETICQGGIREKIEQVRPTVRDEVSTFVTTWFVENRFKDSPIKPRVAGVYFEDEALPSNVAALLKLSQTETIQQTPNAGQNL